MQLTILGSNSATQVFDRHPSAQVLDVNGALYLIDCGEGTVFRLNKFKIKRNKIKAIFISHLHGDHFYGIMGLLTTMSLNQRKKSISIICPKELKEIIELQTINLGSMLNFEINYIFHTDSNSKTVFEDENITVTNIPLTHRIMTSGFRIEKKFKEYKIIPEKINEYQLEGPEISEIINKGMLTKGNSSISLDDISSPNQEKCIYTYCSDTRYDEKYLDMIKESDTLYHESTFMEEHKERAIKTYHSTSKEAALAAKKSKSKKLIIGHFSSRYQNLSPMLEEARTVFKNTDLALEGKTFEI